MSAYWAIRWAAPGLYLRFPIVSVSWANRLGHYVGLPIQPKCGMVNWASEGFHGS